MHSTNPKDKGRTGRSFLKTAGAAGLGSLLAQSPGRSASAAENAARDTVPQRPFGKSGKNLSMLGLGGMLDTGSSVRFRFLEFEPLINPKKDL